MTPAELVTDWLSRTDRMKDAHYSAATVLQRSHMYLGFPSAVLSAIVGAAVFASLSLTDSVAMQVTTGLISLLASVLAGLQTFLRQAERAAAYRVAGANYGTLKSELQLIQTFLPADPTKIEARLEIVRRRWDEIREKAPALPSRLALHFRLVPDVPGLLAASVRAMLPKQPANPSIGFQGVVRHYTVVSGAFLALLTLVQLLRVAMRLPVSVAGFDVPVWVSVVAALVFGSLAIWAFRVGARPDPASAA